MYKVLNLEMNSGSIAPQNQVEYEAILAEYNYYLPLSNAVKYLRFWRQNVIQIALLIGHDAYADRLGRFHPMIQMALETEGAIPGNDLHFDHDQDEPEIFE